MKHIVFIEQYGNMGGGQQVLLELVRSALTLDCTASVLLPAGVCAEKLRQMGAEVVPIQECRLTQGRKRIADIWRFIGIGATTFLAHRRRLRRADLIYVNGNRLLPVAVLAQIFLGREAAYHIHLNHGNLERKLFQLVLRLRSTRALIVPSEFVRGELLKANACFGDPRVRVVANGLDARFSCVPFEDRFTGRPLRHVGIVGRVSPEKGQDILIPLARRFPRLQFHVLGDAAFSSAAYYKKLQVDAPGNVQFHGWVDDIPKRVREIGLQICLVPSRSSDDSRCFESFSLVSAEMTALSCLVAVRRTGALAVMADTLNLPSFGDDDEAACWLEELCRKDGASLASAVQESHTLCMGKYAHELFSQRLENMLRTLLC